MLVLTTLVERELSSIHQEVTNEDDREKGIKCVSCTEIGRIGPRYLLLSNDEKYWLYGT